MSKVRNKSGLDEEDFYYTKTRKVVESEGRIVLYNILNWICPWDHSQTFEFHVKQVLKWKEATFDKHFDATMLQQIRSNPSGDEFDVSLLNRCIALFCRFDPELKNFSKDFVKPIVDVRNDVEHNKRITDEATMKKEIEKMRSIMINTLKHAQKTFKRTPEEIDDLVRSMEGSVEMIKDSSFLSSDVSDYSIVAEIKDRNKNIVLDIGVKSLKENYKCLSNVDPASWISGKERLNVEMVYTRLDIILKRDKSLHSFNVGHEQLLQLKTKEDKQPTFVILEGEAGAGKSTLTKYILAQWADFPKPESLITIQGLEEYNVVLYIECRNKYISDSKELLVALMPKASNGMTDDDLLRTVLSMKTLVIVDGFDECNENSKNLLEKMVGLCLPMSDHKLQFVITTRPTRMKELLKLCGNHSLVHTKITGIPPERRIEFVQKLHDEMIKEKQSEQITSHLVDYMKQSQCRLGEHYRLPLNLTLLCYLWASDPETVNSVTSATSLYDAVLTLVKLRVIDRVSSASCDNSRVDRFLETVYECYLETHKTGHMQLSSESIEKLKAECKEHSLPFEDMCGAFFAVDNELTSKGLQIHLSAPHKSIMEFYVASYMLHKYCHAQKDNLKLTKDVQELRRKYKNVQQVSLKYKVPRKRQTLKNVLATLLTDDGDLDDVDLSHYQNVFIHLGGLLALKNMTVLHECAKELVNILEASDVTETEWLDLVAEAECDSTFTACVAQYFQESDFKKLVIRDGHIGAALEIFKTLDPCLPVQVILQTEVRYIPKIDDLMKELSGRNCSVELLLNNHWRNPDNGMSTGHLEQLCNNKCTVWRFTGNLDDLKILPVSVSDLRITIANDSQATLICKDIAKLNDDEQLEYLGVHVMRGISPEVIRPLPMVKPKHKECGSLWLSEIEDGDVNNSAEVITKFVGSDRTLNTFLKERLIPEPVIVLMVKNLNNQQPPPPPTGNNRKLHRLLLPRCRLSTDGLKGLLGKLQDAGVKVSKMVRTDSLILQKTDENELKTFAKETVGCDFSWGDESSVW